MSMVYPTLPKVAVRDSIDDDDLTDIDDEVFIRDGKNGTFKLDDDGGVKRPLMAPRKKCKRTYSFQTHQVSYKALLLPLCYGITALTILLGLIVLCIYTANIFPMPLTILKHWLSHELKDSVNKSEIIPCTSLSSQVLWTLSLPKLTSEAPLRSNDVNMDGIDDIIVGFSTGLDTMDAPEYICIVYFGNQTPCLGGVLAVNGKTGETIWTHWTAHAIFSVDCDVDLTNDKIKDCVISGRGGILQTINGLDGSTIWEIPIQDSVTTSEQQRILDVYDARFIADIDGDGIGDIIGSHAIQSGDIRTSNVLIISGKSGNVIRSVNLPDSEQLFIAPQILVHPDGENIFILATSSQEEAGGLYIVSQSSMFYSDLQLRKLYHNTGKGALLPPILIDITLDGIEDIVAAMFNSTIMVYDGLTLDPIWNYTIPNSEIISIPIPGYYNDDNVPDFMVKHQIGTGFPTYYYTLATIIDGRNGQPLLEKPIEDSLSRQMSGLSITVDGFGNDWFLHWSADCLNYEGVKEKYQFLKGQSLVSQTRADLCKLRFNSTLTTRLLALSQHVGPPGIKLYFSEDWKSLEFNNSIDPRKEADTYLDTHPRFKIMDTYADIPLVFERSRMHKNHRKDGLFKHKNDGLLEEFDKYDSDTVYENFGEIKDHKKHVPIEDDASENFDADQTWKQDNKWTSDSIQSDKEYDGLYGNDNENNVDEQSLDYPQSEAREQRSIAGIIVKDPYSVNISYENHNFRPINDYSLFFESTKANTLLNSENINREKNRKSEETNNDAQSSENIAMNASMESFLKFQDEVSVIVSNNESNTKEITSIPKLNTLAITNTPIRKKDSNFDLKISQVTHATVSNDVKSQTFTKNQAMISNVNKVVDTLQQSQIYKHSFPNIQDVDDDANIEKVFKRESLKNRNKGNVIKKSLISSSIVKKDYKILQRQRTKRKSDSYNNNHLNEINGIQRQPPTGILLPSIAESKGKTSIDLVFSTFWLPSSEVSLILTKVDLECIHRKKILLGNKLEYKQDDNIVNECLSERGVNYRLYQESMDRENTKIPLGQMTIYRMKLECVCPEDMLPNQTCRNISLHQSWPEHLGSSGNGYFKSLHRLNNWNKN